MMQSIFANKYDLAGSEVDWLFRTWSMWAVLKDFHVSITPED